MLTEMLLIWLAANFLPHGVVYLLTGKPYFALGLRGAVGELTIMALNVALPLLALTTWARDRFPSLQDALAWHWYGWRTVGWGLLGLVLALAAVPLINRLVGSSPFPYGGGVTLKLPRDWALVVLFLLLWVVSTLGEEVMFRGYIQTGLEQRYGAAVGLLGAALLWALRHTPADLYWGWNAPANQWASRLMQLAVAALVFGWVRHRSQSTISTWIMHLLMWIAVVFIGALEDD